MPVTAYVRTPGPRRRSWCSCRRCSRREARSEWIRVACRTGCTWRGGGALDRRLHASSSRRSRRSRRSPCSWTEPSAHRRTHRLPGSHRSDAYPSSRPKAMWLERRSCTGCRSPTQRVAPCPSSPASSPVLNRRRSSQSPCRWRDPLCWTSRGTSSSHSSSRSTRSSSATASSSPSASPCCRASGSRCSRSPCTSAALAAANRSPPLPASRDRRRCDLPPNTAAARRSFRRRACVCGRAAAARVRVHS